MKYTLIGIFGMLGVFARYFVGLIFSKTLLSSFPYGTLLINIVGAFVIGVIYVLGQERSIISPDLRLVIMVGFLGGFTTFSSYCLEAVRLAEEGELLYCFLYLSGSPVIGFSATFLGMFLTRKMLGGLP